MTQAQWLSAARTVLAFLGGWLVAKGYFTQEQFTSLLDSLEKLVGPITTIIALVGGYLASRNKNIVAKAADIVPVSAASQASVGIAPDKIVTSPTKGP